MFYVYFQTFCRLPMWSDWTTRSLDNMFIGQCSILDNTLDSTVLDNSHKSSGRVHWISLYSSLYAARPWLWLDSVIETMTTGHWTMDMTGVDTGHWTRWQWYDIVIPRKVFLRSRSPLSLGWRRILVTPLWTKTSWHRTQASQIAWHLMLFDIWHMT